MFGQLDWLEENCPKILGLVGAVMAGAVVEHSCDALAVEEGEAG